MIPLLRFPISFALIVFLALGLGGCGSGSNDTPAPMSELDRLINDYEKTTNAYVRVAKKHRAGDVSVTVRLIELDDELRTSSAKLAQQSPKMTPPQAQRVASIAAKSAPYLQN